MQFLYNRQAHWQALIDFLASADAPYVFCGVLLALFAYGLLDGWVRLATVRVAVRRAIALVEGQQGTQGLFSAYETLGEQFARSGILARPWAEFGKTVVVDSGRELIRITRRPQEFFNESALLATRLNLRQFTAMPGYLISLGLFFTFIGLVAAIALAAQGLGESADAQQTQAALVKLLDIASLKFISSVAGISLSVILSFFQKAWLNRISHNVHRLCDAIEARTQLTTTEQLLYQWLVAQEQTTRQVAHLADDIATEVVLQMQQQQQQ